MSSPASHRTLRLPALLLAALVAVVALAACSSEASTREASADAGPATTAPSATLPTEIPDGTTLRVGDQLEYLQTVLALAGENLDFPYDVEYSAFIGGPPMLQAFQAGEVDAGFVGSTPLIFAQAQGQDITAVAGWATPNSSYGLLTAPGVDDIGDWPDLEGKRVAFQQGTAGEAALLQALDGAGLTLDDITPVNVPVTETSAALQSGSADAGILVEPLTSVYLTANPDGAQVATPNELTDRSQFLIASRDALDNPAVSAALGDYLARLVRAFTYLADHPGEVAQAVYVDQYGLTLEQAAAVQERVGSPAFFDLPGDIVAPQQRLADLFHANGEIPEQIDVTSEFDNRYNQLVTEAGQ